MYRHKYDGKLYLHPERRKIGESGDRNTVAAVKRVYGGAFSGHNALLARQEDLVLKTFISAAEKCRFRGPPSKQRQKLQAAADTVMKELHKLLNHEVDIHIQRLAERLMDPKTVLKWHPRRNSCQQFVDALLNGEDFEHLFPLFPKGFVTDEGVRKTPGFDWPRYLISFNDHIDGLSAVGFQPKSIISKYCQATRDRCDIVEFAELTLFEAEKKKLKKLVRAKKRNLKRVTKATLKMATCVMTVSPTALAKTPILETVIERDVYQELLLTPCVAGGEDEAEGQNAISEALLDALWDLPRDTVSILQFHLLRPSTNTRQFGTKPWNGKIGSRIDFESSVNKIFLPH
jgi:hypothetical protein